MRKFSFLELANAFRWMYDNISGSAILIRVLPKWDVVIIKRDISCDDVRKMQESQKKQFEDEVNHRKQLAEVMDFPCIRF